MIIHQCRHTQLNYSTQVPSSPIRLTAQRTLATAAIKPVVEKDCRSITPPYTKLNEKLSTVRRILDNRPLTLAEKIVYAHLTNPEETIPVRGETYLKLSPGKRRQGNDKRKENDG